MKILDLNGHERSEHLTEQSKKAPDYEAK